MKIRAGMVVFCLMVSQAGAAIVHFSDEPTWLAAVGPLSVSEDFEGFASDIVRNPGDAPLDLNGLAVEAIGVLPPFGPAIQVDVLPLDFPIPINGSNQLWIAIDNDGGGDDLINIMTFDTEVSAFGTFFNDFGTPEPSVVELLDSSLAIIDTFTPSGASGVFFWGFQATAGEEITALRFRSPSSVPLAFDGFTMDNLGMVNANPVPEPSSVLLTAIGLTLVGVARYRQGRQRPARR